MFYKNISKNTIQAIDEEIRGFLLANSDKLAIKSVSIGGQGQFSNVFFYNAPTIRGAGALDFIGCFKDILTSHDCYTNWIVSLHGHYVPVFNGYAFAGVNFTCVHYKLEEPAPDVYRRPNAGYLGRLDAKKIPPATLERINKAILNKHKLLLRQMGH